MNIRKLVPRIASLSAAAIVSALTAQTAMSAPLSLAEIPLNLTTGVKPNLIMAIDDSGSMDFEVLLPGNDGAAWWRTNASGSCTTAANNNSFTGCIANGATDLPATGRLNFNNSGANGTTWRKFTYLFPNGVGGNTENRKRLGESLHLAIPPLPDFAWARSPEHNRAYFDPTRTYRPWPDGGGFTFTDATPTAARFDPVFTGAPTINLTNDVAGGTTVTTAAACVGDVTAVNTDYGFRVFTGMTIPAGTCIRAPGRSTWELVRDTGCVINVDNACLVDATTGDASFRINTNVSIGIRYFPATFYLSAANAPPASYGYTGPVTSGVAPDGSLLNGYEIKPGNFSSSAAYDAAMQNFANWFSYSRKRHQALRSGLGRAFASLSGWNVAGFTINSASTTGPNVVMGDIDNATTRSNLYTNFYRDWVRSGGTPNRTAVANIIRNYRRTGTGVR